MTTSFNPHCTNISRIKISFPIAPLPTCPPDKPRVYCFVDPCQVTTCPTHPEARCISDYCGGCNARFFDDEGNEVTKSCSKCGYSIIKTGHIKFAVTDQQFIFVSYQLIVSYGCVAFAILHCHLSLMFTCSICLQNRLG